MMSPTEEDFELELRSLSGVMNVEIRHRENGDVDAVTLITHGQDPSALRVMATQIVNLYYTDASVIVEDASRAMAPREAHAERVALVRAEFHTETGNCEVELSFQGKSGYGRAGSGQLFGGAEATLAALLSPNGHQRGHRAWLAGHRDDATVLRWHRYVRHRAGGERRHLCGDGYPGCSQSLSLQGERGRVGLSLGGKSRPELRLGSSNFIEWPAWEPAAFVRVETDLALRGSEDDPNSCR
jgi:hypothetical protein